MIRAGFNHEMADLLLQHMQEQTDDLESLDGPLPKRNTSGRTAFAH